MPVDDISEASDVSQSKAEEPYFDRFPEEDIVQPKRGGGYFYPVWFGQILGDRYRVARKLGYGAFSSVWLAQDLT